MFWVLIRRRPSWQYSSRRPRIDAVDMARGHQAGQHGIEGVDALHDADASRQVDGLGLLRPLFPHKVIDGQHRLVGLAQLLQALADQGHIQSVGVLVVQGAVRHPGVILGPAEEVVQADDLGRRAHLGQGGRQLVGGGGLAAGRGTCQHDDLGPRLAHFLGGILQPPGIAVLAYLDQLGAAAGRHIQQVDLHQALRYPNRDHKTQTLLFCAPTPGRSAGCIHWGT